MKDYHDAILVGITSHEELPEWFKKRPLIMYDIDMIQYKNQSEESVKVFTK